MKCPNPDCRLDLIHPDYCECGWREFKPEEVKKVFIPEPKEPRETPEQRKKRFENQKKLMEAAKSILSKPSEPEKKHRQKMVKIEEAKTRRVNNFKESIYFDYDKFMETLRGDDA